METVLYIAGAFAAIFLLAQGAGALGLSSSDSIDDLGGQLDISGNPVTVKIARAIAVAEGGYTSSGKNLNNGSRPSRNFNPGDMTQDLIGRGVGKDGAFIKYANDQDGWENLYAQVNAWLDGTSRHADASASIQDIAAFYTTTDQAAWAATVARTLGVDVDTSIGELA